MNHHDPFPTTQWTLVRDASHGSPEERASAMEALCRAYWTPLFRFIQHRAGSREDAEDLTQGVFTSLLKGCFPKDLTAAHGRFRSFLLASAKNHLANEWRRAAAIKRKVDLAKMGLVHENAALFEDAQADLAYDRDWAATLVGRALNQLELECAASGMAAEFHELRPLLTGSSREPQKELANRLGRSAAATKILLHRLRRRFLELVERQVRQTVAAPEEVHDEMRHLLRCLSWQT